MAFVAGSKWPAGIELHFSGFDVAEAAVEWRQFGAKAEHGDVDGLAALLAEMVFGGMKDEAADAGALPCGIDGE